MKETRKELIAGLFFIFGLMLFSIVFFAIGSQKGITSAKFKKKVLFSNVGGLSVGAPVRLSGVNVGTTEAIDFTREQAMDNKNIIVVLSILAKYKSQFDSCVEYNIRTEGVLGGKIVEIKPVLYKTCQPVEFEIGKDPLDIQDLTASFDETAKSLTSLSLKIEKYLSQLSRISEAIRRTVGRIEDRVIEGNIFGPQK